MSLPQVPLQARCPFPLVSLPCSWVVSFPQPSCRSFSPALTIAVHAPLPLVQLCTDVLPSRHPLHKTLHQFMLRVTPRVLSNHASYLSSLFSSPRLAGFGKWKSCCPYFQKAKEPSVVAEKPALTKYAETQLHKLMHFCMQTSKRVDRKMFFFLSLFQGLKLNVFFQRLKKKKKRNGAVSL